MSGREASILKNLRHADCMDVMAAYPDNHFDLAIVDPPYGIEGNTHRRNDNRGYALKAKNYPDALWDQQRPSVEYFVELRRVSKHQIIWGGNHLIDLIVFAAICDQELKLDGPTFSPAWLVWDKHTDKNNFADCELAYTSFKTAARRFSYPWNGMIQGFHGNKSKNEKRIHPTQKPVELYEWILSNYAKQGQRVLDTHAGSMSSVIAAMKWGFEIVACELEAEYYEPAIERVKKAMQHRGLFA